MEPACTQLLLTIAIPTFNRPEPLVDTLRQLKKQPDIDHCRIVVVDNASPEPVEEMLSREAPDLLGWIQIRRNVGNLGLSGNILRCFEVGTEEWLWILADDDDLAPDAVTNVVSLCLNNPSVDFILMGQGSYQSTSDTVSTIREFADALDDWNRITFISAGIYRRSKFQKLLNVGINYAYSVVPFMAMIFVGIESHGFKAKFDAYVPVTPGHKSDSTWTWIWSINTYTVCELVEDTEARKRLMTLASSWCLGPVGLTHDFCKRRLAGSTGLSRQAYEHKLHLISSRSAKAKILATVCRAVSHLPAKTSLLLIEQLRNLSGRGARNQRGGEAVFGQA